MTITFKIETARDVMTPDPVMIAPDATLQSAAKKMEAVDCGVLPVGSNGHIKGIITDRDIVIRAVAQGKNPAHAKVQDFMTGQVHACNEDDSLEEAVGKMRQHKVSRLIVKNKAGRMTGILSFGCILRNDASPEDLAHVIRSCSGPCIVSSGK